jgi:hypothetical protein
MVRKFCKGYEEAYFTLEASLIFPMVLLFTVMMIFLAFYSYNRCMLDHSAYTAAIIGSSNHYDDADEAADMAKYAAAVHVGDRLFAVNSLNYDVSVDAGGVSVTYHAGVNMPCESWLRRYITTFSGSDLDLDITRKASRIRATKTIRTWRSVNNLISERKE